MKQKNFSLWLGMLAGFITAVIVNGAVWIYVHSTNILEEDIKERLQGYATLAAMQFTPEELSQIQDETDITSPAFESVVKRLDAIQQQLPEVVYVYIMRKTDDPMKLAFIAENDMLDPVAQSYQVEGIPVPGQLFDISNVPAMQSIAWQQPTADQEITHDAWGSWMSGYAPIRNATGEAIAIVGMDMDAAQFIQESQEIFSPSLLLIILSVVMLGGMGFVYLQWRNRWLFLQALEDKRRNLVTIATHKMGNPIATLRWWLELMEEESTNKDEAKKKVQTAVDKLGEVVVDLENATKTDLTGKELIQKLAKETHENN